MSVPYESWGAPPEPPKKPFFPTGRRELLFGAGFVLTGWLLCNSILFGGFNLGYALFSCVLILLSAAYLLTCGHRLTVYSGALLAMSLLIAASFARADDGFVKFVMLCFLTVSVNLGLCLCAGQNRRSAGGIGSLLDSGRAALSLGVGKLPESFRGLSRAFQTSGTGAKRSGAVLLGLVIALPLLGILVYLLMRADAAFEAVLRKLPDWNFSELLSSVVLGTALAVYFYTRATAVHYAPKAAPAQKTARGVSPLTVNTVLWAVCAVYLVYLLSQLAYFANGLLGILPEEYTLAQYARRGFFEMAGLCAVNVSVIALAVGLVQKQGRAPLTTRLLCLFLGLVTLFLVVTASAKMLLYITAYGLTRLRVLTEVVTVFLGITTALVCVWLFVPRLPYMKAVLLTALMLGAAVSWADVDTLVAHYNVTAYRAGTLETVDVAYLGTLGSGAVPYLQMLETDSDPQVAADAQNLLENSSCDSFIVDFRSWNYAGSKVQFP